MQQNTKSNFTRTAATTSQKGFTLVEIMIVLVILGGLMAFLVPSVSGQRDKANVKMAQMKISRIATALEAFYGDCNQYPDALDQLMQKPSEDVCDNWGPTAYLKKADDLRDPWKNDFLYEIEGGGFIIKSLGKDKQEGGEGYDADISSENL